MYPSLDEQPKPAYGSHNYQNPSHPIQYPQPAVAVGVPAYNNGNTNYREMPLQQQQHRDGGNPSAWTTGLCGCTEDCSSCCLTYWCPCIAFGQIAEIADNGSTSCGLSGALYALMLAVMGCASCYSCVYRTKLRAKFNLAEDPCGDCLVHCCCESCALCQEYRELKNRGFDPALGWKGNLEKQERSTAHTRVATAPPMGQAMNT